MFNLLLRLIILSAIIQLGLRLTDLADCRSKECRDRLERASREVLHINWKPISVLPSK